MSSHTVSCVSTMLPQQLIVQLETEKGSSGQAELKMRATATFILNIIGGVCKALEKCYYKKFDPNVGDDQCQNVALTLRRLVQLKCVQKESQTLAPQVKSLRDKLSKQANKPTQACGAFFKEHISSISLSKEMEYLVHTFLLATLRKPRQVLPNGIVNTYTDMSALSSLSKRISVLDKADRNGIVEQSQCHVSRLTHLSMQKEGEKLGEKLVVRMLSDENTCLYTPDVKYKPKTFVCQFYAVMTVLHRLRKEKALIGLRSIVPKGETPFHILFQPKEAGGRFERVDAKKIPQLNPKDPIVIFHAVVTLEREKAAKKLMKVGFTETVLTCASKVKPYHPKSTLDDVKDTDGKALIGEYAKKTHGSFLIMDHIYLNTLGGEKIT